ncbi:hypothetical protein QFC19_000043 [Naganishia cerealis]|uniref:Uncharacterized protein n=1 Tax=Naganishia cerealis TaxID=610337 RepID=A0ACC2WRR0_9TREE|nr:hypothetical protein QFC19_000043 [Naganishia cerealis]
MAVHPYSSVTTRASRSAKAAGKLPASSASPIKIGESPSSSSSNSNSNNKSNGNSNRSNNNNNSNSNSSDDEQTLANPVYVILSGELLLPVTPFGGFGGGSKVLFWGEELSRNNIIAKIVSFATKEPYTAKQISSRKQTIIKSLLGRFDNSNLQKDVRENAGAALVRIARGTPLTDFLAGYLITSTDEKVHTRRTVLDHAARSLIAIENFFDKTTKETGWCAEQNRLFFSPLLAHMLGLGSKIAARAEEGGPLVYADERLHPVIAAAAFGFGKAWWRYLVARNMELVRA